MPTPRVTDLLKILPECPGVYLMKDRRGGIIYVGKSVNLRSRVNSYFSGTQRLNFAKKNMVALIADIEWIEAKNEVEALVLETNLIKTHRPKYNVLMKDDKNLAYIKITDDPVPEAVRTRRRTSDGTYYGPYVAGTNVGAALSVLRKAFRVRACRMKFAEIGGRLQITAKAGRSVPCLDYYIGLCPAPCTLKSEALAEHAGNVERLRSFLRAGGGGVVDALEKKMHAHAEAREYEAAAKIRDQIRAIRGVGIRQIARGATQDDTDAIAVIERYGRHWIGTVEVRAGEITGFRQAEVETHMDETIADVLATYAAERYIENAAPLVLLLEAAPDGDTLATFLRERRVSVETPSIGPKKELLDFAKANILSYAYRQEMASLESKTLSRATMASILSTLGYDPPKSGEIVFECNDISHTSGRFTVASRSVTVNGKADSSRYRKYNIKSLADGMIDDFASMREVIYRRALEGIETDNFPTMILIDGGKGQLSHAIEGLEAACRERAFASDDPRLPYFASLAKREEEVFVPGKSSSHRFDRGSPELMLLQQLRDEAHRFGINFGRQKRDKALRKNLLEELPGFGPVTRRKLLSLAGSVEGIALLGEDALAGVLSRPQIETLRDHGILPPSEKE